MTRERLEILILWGLLAVGFGCGVALPVLEMVTWLARCRGRDRMKI